jgi:hypothetical protein
MVIVAHQMNFLNELRLDFRIFRVLVDNLLTWEIENLLQYIDVSRGLFY